MKAPHTQEAILLASGYAQRDGEHHKMWVIDQMLRWLLGDMYEAWVYEWEHLTEEPRKWDTGVAP